MGTFYKPLIVLDLAFMNFNVILIWVIFLIYICRSLIRECISVWLRSFTLKAGRSEALRTILRTYYSSEFMLLSPNPETLVTLIVVQWNRQAVRKKNQKIPKTWWVMLAHQSRAQGFLCCWSWIHDPIPSPRYPHMPPFFRSLGHRRNILGIFQIYIHVLYLNNILDYFAFAL